MEEDYRKPVMKVSLRKPNNRIPDALCTLSCLFITKSGVLVVFPSVNY